MAQPMLTKAFLQPAKAAAMCTACHDYAHQPPPTQGSGHEMVWNAHSPHALGSGAASTVCMDLTCSG